MKLLSVLFGALALPLAAGTTLGAAPSGASVEASSLRALPTISAMFPVFGRTETVRPVQLAQSGDPRVVGLEEEVRQLNGRLEELNFQVLQLQEQMRKMQEDVDFRLQEIEQKRGDAGGSASPRVAEAPRHPEPQTPAATADAQQSAQAPGRGTAEKPLGALIVDEKGNVKGGTIDPRATDGATVAALPPSSDSPSELYRDSYEHILSGDYATAEAGFRKHIAEFPKDAQTSDARYWLGEALLGQQRYRDAAEVFVDANRQFPDARKAPDMLLKLGISLSALNQREVACATFEKIGQRYPKASASLKERVKQERALAGC